MLGARFKKSHLLLERYHRMFLRLSPEERFSLIMDIARVRAAETGYRQFLFFNREFKAWEVRSLTTTEQTRQYRSHG